MGPHEPRMSEATAELPAGEHSEAWEPWSSWGRPCPGWCRGGRTAGGMSCQVSTAIRAPQVLLWLNDREVGAEEDGDVVRWDRLGRASTMTCACSTGRQGAAARADRRRAGRGGRAARADGRPCPGPSAGGGRDRDRPGAAGRGAGGGRLSGVCGQPAGGQPLPRPPSAAPGPSPTVGMPRCWPIWSAPTGINHRRVAGDSPAGRGGQGAGPSPSEPDLGPPAARQRAAQRAAGVLPGRAGRPGRPSWPSRRRWPCWSWPRRRSRAAG